MHFRSAGIIIKPNDGSNKKARGVRSSLEAVSARSRIEDLDVPKAVSEQKKNKLLEDYRLGMLRRKMQDNTLAARLFGNR